MSVQDYERTVSLYPEMKEEDVRSCRRQLERLREENDSKIIVLDDDPTGIQTVHDVCVYTDWTEESIERGLLRKEHLFYILTNSRALTEEETVPLHALITERIERVASRLGKKVVIISRGDSTLRGHFPAETRQIRDSLEQAGRKVDGEILIPFFAAGGRFTVGNVHYVKRGNQLIPAGETEFAKDKTFGYESSDLCGYIEEKTHGEYPAKEVLCISLEELRGNEIEKIRERLMGVSGFKKVVVNALTESDLTVFCTALYGALNAGKYFLYRTAADFVKVFGGITDKPLLERREMIAGKSSAGGVVVVGSHTAKTTGQLVALKETEGLCFMEFQSDMVLSDGLSGEVKRVVCEAEKVIKQGRTAVIYTNRRLLTCENDTRDAALNRSVKISEAVSSLVGSLKVKPSFIVAKGGITSSDIGVKALGVKEAYVLGQIQPGIPVWKTDEGSKFPGIPYIIFPGNVGETDTLKKVVEILL